MTIVIGKGDPRDPGSVALLEQSHALMRSLFPSESNHYLSIDQLCLPEVAFFVAREGDRTIGCGALKSFDGYGEIKSMFVDPDHRGKGVADDLLRALEAEARAQGLPLIRLETGDLLHAAHRVYQRHGFRTRGPFGTYTDDPRSIFMEKALT